MQLNKQLVLSHYLLKQFGYESFEELRNEFNDKKAGISSTGYTFFGSLLLMKDERKVKDSEVKKIDEAVQEYEKKLRENRAEPFFSFKYYQYFSLLFSEYFFENYFNNAELLIAHLNEYLKEKEDFSELSPYTKTDLKKLAYWMATGSGKTLIMHSNYWQISKFYDDWENIILITPNEGLSRQHYESFIESGIPAKLYTGSEVSIKTKKGEVLILEITKLVKEKEGEGVTIAVDRFAESKNLVFIDEGHKGQKSDEQIWKGLREFLTRGENSFTIEYSATFGQVVSSNKGLLQEYGKSIIFDYSYRHFYSDGYGKDFSVFNLEVQNEYSEEETNLLLIGSLLAFYEQLALYSKYKEEINQYQIEKPLWIFVGSKVLGPQKNKKDTKLNKGEAETVSDVSRIIKFFQYVLSSPKELQKHIDNILNNQSGLIDAEGYDIFKNRFLHLKEVRPEAEEILSEVFNGLGSLEGFQIKKADGEIGLKIKTDDRYFAVVNIGDVPKYTKKLQSDTDGKLVIQDDKFSNSLFHSLSEPSSHINILIGSKKFIEGWNSWRVSSMSLMNMGGSEGAQIIQLFGRGVRLKGRNFSLKREEVAQYHIKALQTISIMGLNASYLNRFLTEIEKESPPIRDFSIELKKNNEEAWNGRLLTFKNKEDKNFVNELVELTYKSSIAKRVTLDLRNTISVASGGFNSQIVEDRYLSKKNFLKEFISFIDFDSLLLEVNRYKLMKGYKNLIIHISPFRELILDGVFKILSHDGQFQIEEAIKGKIHSVAINVSKNYLNKFYADCEKEYLSENLTYDVIDSSNQEEIFPKSQELIVKVPQKYSSLIKELEDSIKEIYNRNDDALPTIHFDRHLYSPIASMKDGELSKEVKTVPVRLNKGEKDFIKDLKSFALETAIFEGKEMFILRNLSRRGAGFFTKGSSFFPDFIVWVIDDRKQYVYFLDPKGIFMEENNFNNPKIIWCRDSAPELSKKIEKDLRRDGKTFSVSITAFILSVTAYENIQMRWAEGTGTTREEFASNNVLFIEDNKDYLADIFSNLNS